MINRRLILLVIAFCLAGLSMVVTADRLASVGIMDASLTSDNPLTRNSALRLVHFARNGLLGGAVVLIALSFAITRIEASAWFEQRIDEGSAFPEPYLRHQRTVFNKSALAAFSGLIIAILYVMFGNGLSDETLVFINVEDGVIEWISALILLAASLVALGVSRGMLNNGQRRMHVFLAILFFVMFGEEISWGQRLFDFSTPEQLARVNVQGEANLHNSLGYVFDHLFILGFFMWGCMLPLLYWSEPIWQWFQSRLGLPFPSAGLGLAMLGVTLFQEQITDVLFGVIIGLRVPELRELLSALCFLLLMLESKRLAVQKN